MEKISWLWTPWPTRSACWFLLPMISCGFCAKAKVSLWVELLIHFRPYLIKSILCTQSSKSTVGYSSHCSVFHSFLTGFADVIALLCGRTPKVYKGLLSVLNYPTKRLDLKFEPKRVTSDFEKARIKTVAEEVNCSGRVNWPSHIKH